MTRLVAVGTLVALILSLSLQALACGKERWPVKVGTDKDVALVKLVVVDTTITDLRALSAPKHPNSKPANRYRPVELTVYAVSATLTFIKPETDQDYHIVLKDSAGKTMIVESPNPDCAKGSRFETQIAAVRAVIDNHFQGPITRPRLPRVPVTVTGVGFFDLLHGQTGVASNGIELHPILDIQFN